MTVEKLIAELELTPIAVPEPEREVTGGYAGDLLSWVMGRAKAGDAWVTIMSNLNIVAVASLADTAVVILAENVVPEQEVIDTAKTRNVNICGTKLPVYELCCSLRDMI